MHIRALAVIRGMAEGIAHNRALAVIRGIAEGNAHNRALTVLRWMAEDHTHRIQEGTSSTATGARKIRHTQHFKLALAVLRGMTVGNASRHMLGDGLHYYEGCKEQEYKGQQGT